MTKSYRCHLTTIHDVGRQCRGDRALSGLGHHDTANDHEHMRAAEQERCRQRASGYESARGILGRSGQDRRQEQLRAHGKRFRLAHNVSWRRGDGAGGRGSGVHGGIVKPA